MIVDLFNLFNLGGTESLENRDNSNFGSVRSRQTPFHAQLGLRYEY